MLQQLLPANLFAILLVFTRTGAALMMLPGFGDLYVPQRFRLLLALLIAALLAGALGPELPRLPGSPAQLCVLLFGEIVIGLFLGTVARMLQTALETAGMIVSFQLGISAAQTFNPAAEAQGAITGAFLSVLGALVIFLTDTHHILLKGLVGSYRLFPAGALPAFGDLSDAIARTAAGSFALAAELAAPFIVLGTVFFVALALLSRLMPQLQIFFVILPVQIAGGLAVLAATLYAMTAWFLHGFDAGLAGLFPF